MKRILAALCAAALFAGGTMAPLRAEEGAVKIGVLTDLSGFLSSSLGEGSIDGARMAIEDFGGEVLGQKIELVSADHVNKPDVGLGIARKWYDEGVDVIADIGNSAVGLGVQELAREKKKLVLFAGASSSAFTGKACSPYGTQWSHDTYMFSSVLPKRLTKAGDDTWFLVVADFAFGHAMQADVTKAVEQAGGKVVGTVRHPPGTTDFSSFLFQAQGSGAKAVALMNAITDTTNSIKQWQEFQLGGQQKLIPLVLLVNDVKALGLDAAQGVIFPTVFYWDLDDKTRAWAERFYKRNGFMPAEAHAGTYSAVLHYLKAVKAAGTKDPDKVSAMMKAMPVNDFYSDNVEIREDGRVMRKSYIAEAKSPAESKGPWDLYKILETVPAEESWRPLAESDCPLVKH
ncbi:ABC transporter substrate-binding protein [Rhodoligotrophos defluvii]|uniref:ABC transporter substrate-binding protein n=1 Tax=Rhodoligotrophos defluvii TaxID=2561934 RepID=UPI0010C94B28|nr:ABC transporter substrate-binding protein [Rhodoligotrophos defluvii]